MNRIVTIFPSELLKITNDLFNQNCCWIWDAKYNSGFIKPKSGTGKLISNETHRIIRTYFGLLQCITQFEWSPKYNTRNQHIGLLNIRHTFESWKKTFSYSFTKFYIRQSTKFCSRNSKVYVELRHDDHDEGWFYCLFVFFWKLLRELSVTNFLRWFEIQKHVIYMPNIKLAKHFSVFHSIATQHSLSGLPTVSFTFFSYKQFLCVSVVQDLLVSYKT